MYAWGSTVHGELGVGGIEDEYIYTPRLLEWTKDAKFVTEVACSVNHTLFLTKDGKVYSCGNNDYGQLGHSQPRKRPHPIHDLNAHQITHIACGLYHSMALDTWGKVFTWGSNSCGQLGNPQTEPPQITPKIVKKLNTSHVLQIACGEQHCLALTSDGNIYAWGANDVGQLGVGTVTPFEPEPVIVSSISGVPFSFIACGSYHSFALSTSGCVFGWGKNSRGQLGLNDRENKMFPQQVRILRNVKVRYISCGEEFSIFLTYDGGVFTCGAGTYGQLGHGNKSDELLPKMIMELMGSTITQVVCGRRHTLAFLSTGGNVYSFGLGSAGQLGLSKDVNKTLIPQNINGPWVSPTSKKSDDTTQFVIQRIFAGGDHCFATITKRKDKITSYDCRIYDPKSQILTLSFEYLHTNLKNEVKNLDPDVMPYLETVFKSLACINASFLLENHKHYCCSSKNHGVNLVKAEETFNFIARSGNEEAKKLIYDTITSDNNLLKKLCSSPPDVETLRAYLILPLYHEFSNARRYEKLQLLYAHAVLQLQGPAKKILDRWLTTMPLNQYERIVNCYKGVAIFIIKGLHINKETEIIKKNPSLITVLDFLAKLHSLNKINNQLRISTETFILPELNEYVDVKLDYLLWLSDPLETSRLYLCNYPYLFDTEAKVTLLQLDTYLQRVSATNEAARRAALTMFLNLPRNTQENQFLQLFIDRSKITDCTIQQLEQVSQTDLRKPLKVKFLNEDGEDAGGVKKEFFLLVLRDILDPKYGMFMNYDESTRLHWFMPQPLESSHMYGLIGMICGLAIYNSITIYLPFPLAMYKKILKEEATLADLCELNPMVGKSMKAMLDYEGHNFEEHFCEIYFEISYSNLGETVSVDLIPNGKDVRVTLENRQDYVKHYVDFIFNKSCKQQFEAFRQQFVRVCESRVMKLFHAYELMALVTGNENYDWFKLQEVAKYKDGYSSSDPQIVWFWEVIHEMTLNQKKDFLLFLTGTDRVPIQGMGEIEIEIQPMADDRYLPVAHTCTHQLDLPRYRTKERLKYKLLQAIQHNQGFTIV